MKFKLINEGIYKDINGNYHFNFRSDSDPNTIVFFHDENDGVKTMKTLNLTIYYGFENRKGFTNDAIAIAKLLKGNVRNQNVQQFMDLAIEEFRKFITRIKFNPSLVTYPESSSNFNEEFARRLGITPIVHNGFEKLFASDTSVDLHVIKDFKSKSIKPALDKIEKCINNFKSMVEQGIIGKNTKIFSDDQRTDVEYFNDLLELCKTFRKMHGMRSPRSEIDEVEDKIIDEYVSIWSKNEFRKLIKEIEKQDPNVKFNIKNLDYKDKRQFIDFLTYNINLSQQLIEINSKTDQKVQVLVIDDNIDSGGTFEIINRLNRIDIQYLFYAPFRIK